MKFERNNKYTTIAIYAFLVVVASILFYYAFLSLGGGFPWIRKVMGFLKSVIYGLVFAFLLNPVLRFVETKLLGKTKLRPTRRRGVGLLITYLFVLAFLALFFSLVIPQVFASAAALADNIQGYINVIMGWYNELVDYSAQGEGEFSAMLTGLLDQALLSLQNTLNNAGQYISQIAWEVWGATQRITTGIIMGVVNFVLGLIVSLYLLMDREKMMAQTRKALRALLPERGFHLLLDIAQDANRIVGGFVVGKVIDSVIIGIICFIGMTVFRLPYAALISMVIGITNVIPYFGPFLGAIPCAFIILVDSPIKMIWFVLFILALQQFDGNILGPKILGDSIGLSPFWIIFSIMLFNGLLGMLGMFIGVPLFAIIYSLFKRFTSYLLERKGESPNTRDYASEANPLIK